MEFIFNVNICSFSPPPPLPPPPMWYESIVMDTNSISENQVQFLSLTFHGL